MNEMPTIRVLQFKTDYLPGKDPVEWVEYAPISSIMTNRVWVRISHIKPPEHLDNDDEGKKMAFMRHRWSMIEPAYDAWKKGQEIPVTGTPLAAWSGITRDQAEILAKSGFRTIEEVANMPSASVAKLPLPDARDLPGQAKAFLESTDRAVAAQEMANRDAKIAALEEQLEAAMELLNEQTKGKPRVKDAA